MLPRASLHNVDGSTGSIPDPKKRTLVAVIWATWCGPCREEMPFVQALHEKLGKDGSTALVTLSLDDNPGLIAPFLRERRFSFPVLLAKDYVESLPERSLSVPRTWIVSPEGRIVLESSGFAYGETLESWLRRVETALSLVTDSSGP
jgi:thiol-disulfide isomerase/thioredoxin